MKKTLTILAAMSVVASSQAVIFTQWNFNSVPADALTSTGSILPSTGAGTASLVGTTATFASGGTIITPGSTDPALTDNTAWNTSGYQAATVGSGTRGVQFLVSTAGQQNIIIKWDQRHSNTSSKFSQFQYTVDGTNFITTGLTGGGVFTASAGDTWFNNRTVDLSTISGVNNNVNFGFRVVAIFAPSTSAYTASTVTSTYGTTGTNRFDMVTVDSEPVPEPATMIALLAGATAMLARRKKA